MTVLTVIKNGGSRIALPADTLIKVAPTLTDLDAENGTGRNQKGELFRDRVCTKRKVDVEWGLLTVTEMARILTAIEDEFFDLVYPDPKTGTGKRITCYVGDRSTPLFSIEGSADVTEGGNLSGYWNGLSVSFVEK